MNVFWKQLSRALLPRQKSKNSWRYRLSYIWNHDDILESGFQKPGVKTRTVVKLSTIVNFTGIKLFFLDYSAGFEIIVSDSRLECVILFEPN